MQGPPHRAVNLAHHERKPCNAGRTVTARVGGLHALPASYSISASASKVIGQVLICCSCSSSEIAVRACTLSCQLPVVVVVLTSVCASSLQYRQLPQWCRPAAGLPCGWRDEAHGKQHPLMRCPEAEAALISTGCSLDWRAAAPPSTAAAAV